MGSMSLIHWIIVGAVLLLLFGGKNKISDVMGDVAKGIKSFKKGLTEDDTQPVAPAPRRAAARRADAIARPGPRAGRPRDLGHPPGRLI